MPTFAALAYRPFYYFYGPGDLQDFLLTSFYVILVKIIGLCVDLESLLRTLRVLV